MKKPNANTLAILNSLAEKFPDGFHHTDIAKLKIKETYLQTRLFCSQQCIKGRLIRLHEGRYMVRPESIGKNEGKADVLIQQVLQIVSADQLLAELRRRLV